MNKQRKDRSPAFRRHARLLGWLAVVAGLLLSLSTLTPAVSATPAATPTPPFLEPRRQALEELGLSAGVRAASAATAPEDMVYTLSGEITALQKEGDRLYAGMGDRFVVFDVSDPTQPRLLNQTILGNTISDIWIVADRAYLRQEWQGSVSSLDVIDLKTNPPRLLARLAPPRHDIILQEGTRFFFIDRQGYLEIWDWSQPAAPVVLSQTENLWTDSNYNFDAVLQGSLLYVLNNVTFSTIDVSDLRHPRVAGRLSFPTVSMASSFAVQGSWAYLVDISYYKMHIIDISNPAQPQEKATIQLSISSCMRKLLTAGTRLYFIGRDMCVGPYALSVFDISQSPQITQLGATDIPSAWYEPDTSIITSERLMYTGQRDSFVILSLQTPESPTSLGSYRFPSTPAAIARGGPALLYTAETGLATLLDVRNPLYPQVLWWETSEEPWQKIIVGDRYLFLSAERYYDNQGWHDPVINIYDRNNPTQPRFLRQLVGVFKADGGLQSRGDLLIGVSRDQKHLRILDVTQTGEEAFVFDGPLAAEGLSVLALHEDALFLRGRDAQGSWRLYQYDIMNPAEPRLIGTYHHALNLHPASLLLYKGVAYATMEDTPYWTQNRTVVVLRLSVTAPPAAVREYHPSFTAGYSYQGFIVGNSLVYSNGEQLVWADISQPDHPRYLTTTSAPGLTTVAFEPVAYSAKANASLRMWRLPALGGRMTLDAQEGGRIYAVAAWGDKALVGRGYHLLVYDMQTPSQPRLLGWSPSLAGLIYGIVVQGENAYLALGDKGVQVVDLSDPLHPRPLDAYPARSFIWNVAVAGDKLYVADDGGYAILDASDPTGLQLIKQTESPSVDIALIDGLAALGTFNHFQIDDVSDPARILARSLDSRLTENVSADGRFFYAAQGFQGLSLYNPAYAGNISPLRRYALPGYTLDVAIQDHAAYALDWMGSLHRLDLTDIRNPLPPRETIQMPGMAWNVAPSGNAIYVSLPEKGFAVVEQGEHMQESAVVRFVAAQVDLLWALNPEQMVAGSGTELYLTDLRAGPAAPPLAHITLPAALSALSGVSATAYAGTVEGQLLVLDAQDAGGLATLATLDFSAPIRRLLPQPPYLFLQAGDDALHILDMSNPAQPALLTTLQTTKPLRSVAATANALYLAVEYQGVQVFDLSDPAHPTQMETISTPASVLQLASDDAYLALWESGYGFEVFTLTDPLHPTYRFSQASTTPVDQMLLHQGRLITLTQNERVRQYLISPENRTLIPLDTQLEPAGGARGAAPVADALIVATHSAGIQRYRTQKLWTPLVMGLH